MSGDYKIINGWLVDVRGEDRVDLNKIEHYCLDGDNCQILLGGVYRFYYGEGPEVFELLDRHFLATEPQTEQPEDLTL
jgi:hypothetical protein